MSRPAAEHVAGGFREDAPRPPVPGEEGEAARQPAGRPPAKAEPGPAALGARRDQGGLGEPEGSASPDSPLRRWTRSLHSLLGDQDGALLFRTFLEADKRADTLDFWFACNGFRLMDLKDGKTQRAAKAIYKRYVESEGVVARLLKPATKTFIRDSVRKRHVDSAMFDQAQTEIQAHMEGKAYRLFLSSEVFLEFVRSAGEGPDPAGPAGPADLRLLCRYLPALREEEEWTLEPRGKRPELAERGRRFSKGGDACPAGTLAPVSSTNDSEVSSDALTDDGMSVTDGGADGVPPYKVISKKLLHRDMQRNVHINRQAALPAFPRTRRPPAEGVPVEPAKFAAQLISRLESLKRERDTLGALEEDDREDPGTAPRPPGPLPGPSEEDPQAILDEHLSRVLKTPGRQSPAVIWRSPRSASPDGRAFRRPGPALSASLRAPAPGPGPVPAAKRVHRLYIHRHAGPKTAEQFEREAALRARTPCCRPFQRSRSLGREMCGAVPPDAGTGRSSSLSRRGCCPEPEEAVARGRGQELGPPCDAADPAHNVLQWILESTRQGRHKSGAGQSGRKSFEAWGGGGGNRSHLRVPRPSQPFVQDPAMPPLPPPNTLAQLEEACRRLEEVSVAKPAKQRHSLSALQRDRSHFVHVRCGGSAPMSPVDPGGSPGPLSDDGPGRRGETVVTYFFCGEEIPYRRTMKSHGLTLGHFKEQLRKRGSYRFYFKKASDEFECGAVFEEVSDDGSLLPTYEGKILGKVERME